MVSVLARPRRRRRRPADCVEAVRDRSRARSSVLWRLATRCDGRDGTDRAAVSAGLVGQVLSLSPARSMDARELEKTGSRARVRRGRRLFFPVRRRMVSWFLRCPSTTDHNRDALCLHGTTFNAETAELAEQDRLSLRVPRALR